MLLLCIHNVSKASWPDGCVSRHLDKTPGSNVARFPLSRRRRFSTNNLRVSHLFGPPGPRKPYTKLAQVYPFDIFRPCSRTLPIIFIPRLLRGDSDLVFRSICIITILRTVLSFTLLWCRPRLRKGLFVGKWGRLWRLRLRKLRSGVWRVSTKF